MEIRPNKSPQISSIEYVHSRLSINQGTKMIDTKYGERIHLSDTDFEVLKIYILNVGNVLVYADFVGVPGWQNKPENLAANHRASFSRLRSKLYQVGISDENFPDGYLLTIRGHGTTMVNPDLPSHIQQFKPYVYRSTSASKK
ncbi:MAG: helix-turn-helix domain-containing protein [Candidatus Levybacteria bacterium]|nr:helix-turn-helix domain-containing protein [Candidatus Levybacteria bacterium]